jgi:hypothetical protein
MQKLLQEKLKMGRRMLQGTVTASGPFIKPPFLIADAWLFVVRIFEKRIVNVASFSIIAAISRTFILVHTNPADHIVKLFIKI